MENLAIFVTIGIYGYIYFLPTIVSIAGNHRQSQAIFILNILLGWTLVGWVIALIWSTIKGE